MMLMMAIRALVLVLAVGACTDKESELRNAVYAPAGVGDIFVCVPEEKYCTYSHLYFDQETCTQLLCRILLSEALETQRIGDYELQFCDDADNCQRVVVNEENEIVAFFQEDVGAWWFSVSNRRVALAAEKP
ncbi:MAG: hypothetical protein Q8S09_00200 [Hyphomonas sp.]|nr:hypothetical protein [Hyphomonas sp.]